MHVQVNFWAVKVNQAILVMSLMFTTVLCLVHGKMLPVACKSALLGSSGFNPLVAIQLVSCNFQVMMSLQAMSLGVRFCTSRKGGTEEGRWIQR